MVRLFMSTDVAGSTFFKAKFVETVEVGWLEVFKNFFSKYPIMMTGQVGMEFLDEETLPKIDVWKVMGDEAIFTCVPRSPEETTLLLRALFNTMTAYEEEYLADLPLRLKGTAWLATFPNPNIEIEIPELSDRQGGVQIDYIGPDIDLGFRISKFARPSAITVSLDLLDVLLQAKNGDLIDFFLVGREELKGVLFGRPYPVVWARPADAPLGFMPWEVDDCEMIAHALAHGPASRPALVEAIDGVRRYLRKMHGAQARPIVFGDPAE